MTAKGCRIRTPSHLPAHAAHLKNARENEKGAD